MDNCPHQVVLCGTEEAIEGAYGRLIKEGAICNYLPFERAYHTAWYRPVCEHHARPFVEGLNIQPPKIVTYSCATAQPYPKNVEEIKQILVEQWALPVRFRETIEAMYEDGVRIFVEVGPRGNLSSFVEDILERRPYAAVAANIANRSGLSQLNHMVGLLAAHGVPMCLDYLYAHRNPQVVSLQVNVAENAKISTKKADTHEAGAKRIKLKMDIPILSLNGAEFNIVPEKGASPREFDIASIKAAKSLSASAVVSESPTEKIMSPGSREKSLQGRPQSSVMHEYLRSMDRFLELQQKVMKSYLQNKNRTFKGEPEKNVRSKSGNSS
jgi:acyl transferase domain-containing protein